MSVVGRAYVTVRAVTAGVERDIQSGVDRALTRANVDNGSSKVAQKVDTKVGKEIGEGDGIAKGVDKALARAGDSNSGNKVGDKIGQKMGDAAGKKYKGIISKVLLNPVSPALLNQVGTLVSSLTAGGTALASTFGPVLASSVGVGTNAVIGLGTAFATLKLAIGNKKDGGLADFKSRLAESGKVIDGIKTKIRGELVPVLTDSINGITTGLGPTLKRGLTQTAGSIGGIVTKLDGLANNPVFQGRLSDIFRRNAKALQRFGDAGVASLDALSGIAAAASPLAVRFGTFSKRMSETFANFIRTKEATGGLDKFFVRAGNTTARWGRILGNTGKALFHVFDAGSSTGTTLLVKLEKLTARFDKWTQSIEGQSALKDWFAQAIPVLEATGHFIGAITSTFAKLSGGSDAVVTTLNFLSDGVLPALNAGLSVAVPLGNALLGAFVALSPVLATVTTVLSTVADVVNVLPGPVKVLIAGLIFIPPLMNKITAASVKMSAALGPARFTKASGGIKMLGKDLLTLRYISKGTAAGLERVNASRARLANAGKAAGAIGALAIASSGLADKLELAHTQSDIFTGALIGGPLGAGIGALLGVFQDLKAGIDEFRDAEHGATDALKTNDIDAQKAALAALGTEIDKLAESNSFGANVGRIFSLASGDVEKLNKKYVELNQKIIDEEHAASVLAPVIDTLGNAYNGASGEAVHFAGSLDKINGNLNKTDAYLNYRNAVLDTNKTLAENKGSLNLGTKAGLENRKALQDQAHALLNYAALLPPASRGQDQFLIKSTSGLFKLADSLDRTGRYGRQFRRQFEELGRLQNPKLAIELQAQDAFNKILRVKELMKSLKDRTVRLNYYVNQVNTINKGPVDRGGVGESNGGWLPSRAGGGFVDGYGSPTSDSIAYAGSRVSSREFVVNAYQANRNADLLRAINSGSYNANAAHDTKVVIEDRTQQKSSQPIQLIIQNPDQKTLMQDVPRAVSHLSFLLQGA